MLIFNTKAFVDTHQTRPFFYGIYSRNKSLNCYLGYK